MQTEKKNIAIIGPSWPLRGGGMSTFNERMARQFQSEGHHVTIYTFSLQYPSFLFPGKSQYADTPKPNDLNIKVCINSVNPLNWFSVGKKIKSANHDIVIVRYWLPFMGPALGTILRLVKKNNHSKIFCIADNIIPHEKRPGDKPFTSYFVKPIDAFVTMSQKVFDDLKLFKHHAKVALVTHPLYDNFGEKISKSTARELLNITKTDFVLLFFGFIRKYKGLDLLLHAMPKIVTAIPNARLVVAGEFYDDEQQYRQIITSLNIEKNIDLHTQFIADNEVKNYLCAADVVVQPYRNATQSGVTPLAYHYEVPMIATNVGGLPEMVPHNRSGLIAEPEPDAIANAVIEMHQRKSESFLAGLLEEKKKYSWDKFTATILQLAAQA